MFKKQLCFTISNSFCSIYLYKGESFEFIDSFFFENKTEQVNQEQILAILNKFDLSDFSLDELTVSYLTHNYTLIPNSIFRIDQLSNYYQICFGEVYRNHFVDYNRIANFNLVNVYQIPNWIKSFFIKRFPKAKIQHFNSINFTGVFEGKFIGLNIFLYVFSNSLFLNFQKDNELIYSNSFSINHQNDILYYVSFALNQLDLSNQVGNIYIAMENCEELTSEESLKELIQKVSLFSTYEINFDKHLHYKFHSLCVL